MLVLRQVSHPHVIRYFNSFVCTKSDISLSPHRWLSTIIMSTFRSRTVSSTLSWNMQAREIWSNTSRNTDLLRSWYLKRGYGVRYQSSLRSYTNPIAQTTLVQTPPKHHNCTYKTSYTLGSWQDCSSSCARDWTISIKDGRCIVTVLLIWISHHIF